MLPDTLNMVSALYDNLQSLTKVTNNSGLSKIYHLWNLINLVLIFSNIFHFNFKFVRKYHLINYKIIER